jgi:hypothetical protein
VPTVIRRAARRLVRLLLLLALAATPAAAYETDQFHNRLEPLRDSTAVLNREVNVALADIARSWRGPRDDWRVVNALYARLGGVHWVDRLEAWAMRSAEVDKLRTPRYRSVYAGHPWYATRVTGLFGIGPTLKVGGVLIGSDKIGHFFSQGRKFYRRWLRMRDEARAARHSAFTERAIFGQLTTGDYSNADLVANYEGHRFYRSLFEDGVVAGKPAILAWQRDRWVLQRPFDWADHVTAYWDEALNPNRFDRVLEPHMRARFAEFCADYERAPERYTIPADVDAALAARYALLELGDTRHLRLPTLCRKHST